MSPRKASQSKDLRLRRKTMALGEVKHYFFNTQKQLKCSGMNVELGDKETWLQIPRLKLPKHEIYNEELNLSRCISISVRWRKQSQIVRYLF